MDAFYNTFIAGIEKHPEVRYKMPEFYEKAFFKGANEKRRMVIAVTVELQNFVVLLPEIYLNPIRAIKDLLTQIDSSFSILEVRILVQTHCSVTFMIECNFKPLFCIELMQTLGHRFKVSMSCFFNICCEEV